MSDERPPDRPDVEVWREWVRRMPGVVVHRPHQQTPFEPDINVINVHHMHELIGCDDEETIVGDGATT